jgi:Tfp pilus assembly protein PilP
MDFKPNLKTIAIFLCLASVFLFQGCEKKKDPPAQPQVVSKKINADKGGSSKTSENPVGAASASVSEPGGNVVTQKIDMPEKSPAEKNTADAMPPDAKAEKDDNIIELGKKIGKTEGAAESTALPAPTVATDATALPAPTVQDDSLVMAGIEKTTPLYDPTNKLDPFMPLFKDEPEKSEPAAGVEKKERKKRIPRTPLERIALSQLKLVGVIRAESGDKGLVQEASGKGYIISSGTYIGTNGGKVIEILPDRVIIEEEVEDVLGKLGIQKRELKLQKPFGED